MATKFKIALSGLFLVGALLSLWHTSAGHDFVSYTADPEKQHIGLYWKDGNGNPLKSIRNLKAWLGQHKQQLAFAMNAGMYKKDHSPQGLYIENYKQLAGIDTLKGNGNFYLMPNGVFYITRQNAAGICPTRAFDKVNVKYATQSGPMLLIDGQVNSAFAKGSTNVNIRNGVGILADGKVVFAMSKEEISFYDFASYFKSLGCKNALYLDGFVSRAYLPAERWIQEDGDFGVMIGITE